MLIGRNRRDPRAELPYFGKLDIITAFWFIFIGMFLGQAARTATYQSAVFVASRGSPCPT